MPWLSLTHPPDALAILCLALVLEAAAGYPKPLYRAIGHPVTWIGRLIGILDAALNQGGRERRRAAGLLAVIVLLLACGAVALALTVAAGASDGVASIALLGAMAASLPAQRSLHDHVGRVAQSLRSQGLAGGRQAVSLIVGRNPESLDEAAVCRAAIESLAENFSDGVVAPAFWLGLWGLPGGVLYKAINTADSMIGHRTPRHEAFGWAAAKLDDLVNLPASRLTALLIVAAALVHRGSSAAQAWRALARDARHHRSPNAGWPEAAMAGALGLRLAGPRTYGDTRVEDAWMGDGRAEAGPADIVLALRLYRTACCLLFALAGLALALTLR